MDFLTINCPHCNERIEMEWKEGDCNTTKLDESPCCNRTIYVKRDLVPEVRAGIPSASFMKAQNYEGNITPVPGMVLPEQMRPNSRWTIVGTSSGADWFVRLCPHDVDNSSLGRSWGLSFATTFTSPYEAHKFADSIDKYLDGVFAAKLENTSLQLAKNKAKDKE